MQKILTKIILVIFDILFLISIFFIVKYFLHQDIKLQDFIFAILIILLLLYFSKIYVFRYDFWQETYLIYKNLFISFLLILSFKTLNQITIDNYFIIFYFLLIFILFPIFKRFLKRVIFQIDFLKQKVNIIGEKKQIENFKKEIKDNWYLGLKYSTKKYNTLIIISKDFSVKSLESITQHSLNTYSEIYIVPYLDSINFLHSNILEYSNIRKNLIHIENKLLKKSNILIKNIFDKLLAILITPIFLIIHLFIVFLIKLDSKGTVFYKQKRVGKNGKVFEIYKYRTMYEKGDIILKKYLKDNPQEIEYYKKYHKYKNDPRITKVGKFLRSTSLDELPQIINILKSEMSFVGPRPYMINEIDLIKDQQYFILKVKPAITGLWQVNGRSNLSFKERVDLESWYIKNWTLWMDFVILIKTIKVVFKKVGAK